MIAKQLPTSTITPLSPEDSGSEYLYNMDENKISFIPIVDKNIYMGLLSENEIFNLADPDAPIKEQKISLKKPSVKEFQHVFDVIKIMADMEITVLPVVDEKNFYLGCITYNSLIDWMANNTAVSAPGSIIVLELNQNDYVLSQIAQIVESQDVKILSLNISFQPDSTKMDVTLKVNTMEIQALLQTFNRYNYIIKATYTEDQETTEDLRDRYDSLMNYLNI